MWVNDILGKLYVDCKLKVESQYSSCPGKNLISTPFPSDPKECSTESGIGKHFRAIISSC